MVIAVTAATGQLGRKVVKSLLEKVPASEIVAVVRDPAKAADLGVEVRAGDYNDPAALEKAFAGVDKVLLISGSSEFGKRAAEHANVVNAAKKAGVGFIAYTSLLHADGWDLPITGDHKATEETVKASGLPFTILRNGWYWENHTAGLAPSLPYGALTGSAGDGRISWASRQDFADAAVEVLTGDGHEGKTYELAGDVSYTLSELAAEVARQSGKPFAYRNVGAAEHAKVYEGYGIPASLSALLADTEEKGLGAGHLREDGGDLSRLIGRPTTSLEQAVSEALSG